MVCCSFGLNTLRPRQNGLHFPDDIFKCIFLNENVWISLKISLKFVPKGPINNIPALVQKVAWRRPGDKPLSEAMVGSLLMHICVTLPQWVKSSPKPILTMAYYSLSTPELVQGHQQAHKDDIIHDIISKLLWLLKVTGTFSMIRQHHLK